MSYSFGARHTFLRKFGIPEGWQPRILGDLARVVGGATPKREESRFWVGGEIAWATPTDLTANGSKYFSKTAENITLSGLQSCAASLLPVGSILYTSRATIGAKAIATIPMATNQGFASFIPSGIDGEYLFYLLDLLTPVIKRLAAGTTFDEVSKREVRSVCCAVPSSDHEQIAIAKLLNVVENAETHSRNAIHHALELKHAVLQRFLYAALGATAYADRPRKQLPDNWSLVPTGSLLSCDPKNGISPETSSQPPGVPTFSIAAIRNGHVNLRNPDNLKYARLPQKIAEKFAIQQGDILIVRGNANPDLVGRAGTVSTFPERCIYPDIVKRIVFRADLERRIIPAYGVLAWNHPTIHNQILRRAKTSNGTLKINNLDVKQIIMPVPPEEEQAELVRVVSAIDAHIDALTAQASSYNQLRRALQQDLLTGRIRYEALVGAIAA